MSGAAAGHLSARCAIGVHDACTEAEPGETGVPGVRHLACACPCHPAPQTRAASAPAPPEPGEEGWYRLCWSARPDAERDRLFPGAVHGVLVGQDVAAILRGMRGCLAPLVFHDPARVRERACAEGGWSYATDAVAVHARRIAGPAPWAALLACPDPRRGAAR
ncbi:hypothetical protein ACFSJS_12440 [Streptomyces desertarenae]|uniref:Uncharacterized protein n=1 Tax=Streptomyces desertarenae TaxID=2666184 RepID=A0ABW4PKJ8_9ACTN